MAESNGSLVRSTLLQGVGPALTVIGGLIVGALWFTGKFDDIIDRMHSQDAILSDKIGVVAQQNLAQLNALAEARRAVSEALDKRVTTLEVQEIALAHSLDQLSSDITKLREAEEDLRSAVEILTKNLPGSEKRR